MTHLPLIKELYVQKVELENPFSRVTCTFTEGGTQQRHSQNTEMSFLLQQHEAPRPGTHLEMEIRERVTGDVI